MSKNFSLNDYRIMKRLLSLAGARKGATGANPTVASAVCIDGKIVGEGVHQGSGFPHAEVLAITDAGELCKGATLYVTLEPCTHVGRTPACTDLIIRSGISKVIYAIDDPNPLVRRDSARSVLERVGIEVVSGLMEKEAEQLNEAFFYFHRTGKPFVLLKAGLSLDGKIAMASGESTYITSDASRCLAHRLRREADAILVGVGTIIQDNPSLNVRYGLLQEGFKNPVKIILDPYARTPIDSLVFEHNEDTEIIIVVREDQVSQMNARGLSEKATILGFPYKNDRFNIRDILDFIMDYGFRHILIEGGQKVYTAALEDGVVSKMVLFFAPKLLAARGAISPFERQGIEFLEHALQLEHMTVYPVGPDMMVEGYIEDVGYEK